MFHSPDCHVDESQTLKRHSRFRFFTGALRSWWCSDGQSGPLAMDIVSQHYLPIGDVG
jgi:hypothetical protein